MSFITTKVELKEYIFRQLGSEIHDVEITDQNFEDIYNKSIKYFQEHSNEGIMEKVVISEVNSATELTLDNSILSVNKIMDSDVSISSNTVYYPSTSPLYNYLMNGDTALSSFYVYNADMKEMRKMFNTKLYFKFNSETKSLILGREVEKILMVVWEAEDVLSLYSNELLLLHLEASCWRQWATNVGAKYRGSTIGKGIELNYEGMIAESERAEALLKDAVDNEEFDFLAPIRVD